MYAKPVSPACQCVQLHYMQTLSTISATCLHYLMFQLRYLQTLSTISATFFNYLMFQLRYLQTRLLNEETKELDEYEYEFELFKKTLDEIVYEF